MLFGAEAGQVQPQALGAAAILGGAPRRVEVTFPQQHVHQGGMPGRAVRTGRRRLARAEAGLGTQYLKRLVPPTGPGLIGLRMLMEALVALQ
jgi:hypothetical protein